GKGIHAADRRTAPESPQDGWGEEHFHDPDKGYDAEHAGTHRDAETIRPPSADQHSSQFGFERYRTGHQHLLPLYRFSPAEHGDPEPDADPRPQRIRQRRRLQFFPQRSDRLSECTL